jgi:hypothetical protein
MKYFIHRPRTPSAWTAKPIHQLLITANHGGRPSNNVLRAYKVQTLDFRIALMTYPLAEFAVMLRYLLGRLATLAGELSNLSRVQSEDAQGICRSVKGCRVYCCFERSSRQFRARSIGYERA